ncbi:heme NO-binding domain-containing protein [Cytophagales bacterium LB-30]|uniref:Heme NO-binding domain-containing protein n=1 Tax=Shiella aurantiaca TaxID=3058365 RepID=A0ABT8F2V4_9BACT|nr:heme NO-binding domain-containing protein [Shiella aurantiaca]MDN4164787.1 heme NO-binding domain-containing protein [Shiella aurantiaca]
MHGIVFAELQKYVNVNFGAATWFALLKSSGLEGKMYLPTRPYPDEDIFAIVGSACKATGKTADEILESFGSFIAPDLMKIFGGSMDPKWKTLDFLENMESVIHKAVRINNPEATPPVLNVKRKSQNSVEIVYSSKRKMASLGLGLIKAVCKHYGEEGVIKVTTKTTPDGESTIFNIYK